MENKHIKRILKCKSCNKEITKDNSSYNNKAYWCWDCEMKWTEMKIGNNKLIEKHLNRIIKIKEHTK